jgi:diguanylate cyclase (GGDEF)-like protein
MYQVWNCLSTEHDWRLVLLAGSVCFLASAVAISLFDRARASQGSARLVWLALDALVSGCGIWATHFIAILAYAPSSDAGYSIRVTLLSLVFAMLITGVGLGTALSGERRWLTALGGVIVGGGVAAMHYTGMMALELPARIVWSPAIVVASILLGGIFGALVLLDTALENMSQGLCMFDATGRIVVFNERVVALMGPAINRFKDRLLLDLLREMKANGRWDGDPDAFFAKLLSEAHAAETVTRTFDWKERSIRMVDQPMRGGGWVSTFEDITEWQRAQDQISHMARHDGLTNLPNRTLFREELERALHLAKPGDQLAVLCLDLDHFKKINDSLGHPIGDALLREVAERLRGCISKMDTVARLGGDEFAIVQFCNSCDASVSSALAGRIVETLADPFDIHGHQLVIGVSIGISLAPQDGENPDDLLKNADLALYRAKADGRGTYRYFEAGMDARAQARRMLELDLRMALQRQEFAIHYQPIRDLASEEIVVCEALVRWNHPLRGLMGPNQFIPLAEETSLIIPLGDWVLRRACKDAAAWSKTCVAVNLSPVQFKNPNLVASVKQALEESGLPAHRLELEITETALLQNSEMTRAVLHELRSFGVKISLDDFGTGYSSLSYLRSFPFDKIKIDRSFVNELSTSQDSLAIIRAVTGLGKSLGIVTTAEGVETDSQLDLLIREGCTQVQGYLISKPRPIAEVEGMLPQPRRSAVA